jgi:outer membrane immunogenic protein
MKKILMATVGLMALGLAAPASAADLSARPVYTKAPAYAAPVLNWTGFYIGANIGGAWNANNAFGVGGYTNSNNGSFIGGGQIGADYQFAPNWLVGIEANIDGVANNNNTYTNGVLVASRNHDYLGSVTGRLGYVFGPAVVYAKGGLGFTDTKYSLTTAAGTPIAFTNSGNNNTGYTVGGGLEYMFAPNWSAKAEYQYFNFNKGLQYISAGAFPAGVTLNDNVHTFKLGVNYHFNAGGPVVAKY